MLSHAIRHITYILGGGTNIIEMVQPEKWLGRVIPANVDPATIPTNFEECDECGKALLTFNSTPFVFSEAGWALLAQLHIDPAQGFCDECYKKIIREAEQIAPGLLGGEVDLYCAYLYQERGARC